MHTSIAKRDLDVQTRMSDAVFLDPVGRDKRTIFAAVSGRGCQVLDDPDAAQFKLQAQTLSVSKASVTAAEAALNGGYGAPSQVTQLEQWQAWPPAAVIKTWRLPVSSAQSWAA